MASWLWQRVCCCLTGHDYMITSDRARMFLRCRTCGRTSHVLELSESPFRNRTRTRTAADALPASRASSGRPHLAA
jgi:hypothetical protein